MSLARKLDQFYTNPAIAEICHEHLLTTLSEFYSKNQKFRWLEPSAGTGAFLELMPEAERLGVDLDPPAVPSLKIIKQDFLRFDADAAWTSASKCFPVVTEGNPPFGRNASLAIKFFNKAAEFSEIIAFIVPMTFKKPSIQKRLNSSFHLKFEYILPRNSFLFEGYSYHVPCCFQVWIKDDTQERQEIIAPLTHSDFEFVPRERATVAIRRVGGSAGAVFTDFDDYANASHYFILPKIDLTNFIRTIKNIDWCDLKKQSGIHPSISKRELVREYASAKINSK